MKKEEKERKKTKEKIVTYNVRRSEPVPPERSRCMSGLSPRAPLARTLGAEESCIYIFRFRRGPTG